MTKTNTLRRPWLKMLDRVKWLGLKKAERFFFKDTQVAHCAITFQKVQYKQAGQILTYQNFMAVKKQQMILMICLGFVAKPLQPGTSPLTLRWLFRSAPWTHVLVLTCSVLFMPPLWGPSGVNSPRLYRWAMSETRVHNPHWLICPMEGLEEYLGHSLLVKPPSPHSW